VKIEYRAGHLVKVKNRKIQINLGIVISVEKNFYRNRISEEVMDRIIVLWAEDGNVSSIPSVFIEFATNKNQE